MGHLLPILIARGHSRAAGRVEAGPVGAAQPRDPDGLGKMGMCVQSMAGVCAGDGVLSGRWLHLAPVDPRRSLQRAKQQFLLWWNH